jgi:hypothetical protein
VQDHSPGVPLRVVLAQPWPALRQRDEGLLGQVLSKLGVEAEQVPVPSQLLRPSLDELLEPRVAIHAHQHSLSSPSPLSTSGDHKGLARQHK